LLAAFRNEREETVWNVMSLCIADSRRLVETNDSAETAMKAFVFEIVSKLYSELGWHKIDNEPLNDTKLRSTILSLACYSETPEVISEALAQFKSYKNYDDMPADTRHILLAMAVKHGGNNAFDKMFESYAKETNSELQQDICGALSATKKPENINMLLQNLTNSEFVRLQDVDRWIVYLLRNRWSRQATWDWMTTNWSWIEDNFASDKSYDNYPRYAASVFSTKEWQKAYSDFFIPQLEVPALQRNIELGIEEISGRVAWRERDEQPLISWLKAQ
jgi:aminopeptidase N